MSASVQPEDRDAAADAGCSAFIAKPFHPAELVETIQRLFGLDKSSGHQARSGPPLGHSSTISPLVNR